MSKIKFVLLILLAIPLNSAHGQQITFRDITAQAGLHFLHNNGAFGKKWLPETMGPGCAFIDYDNDGYPDILLVNGEDFPGVTGGHEERTVGPKREVPNVLGFGIKEDRLLSGGSDFVDFAIRCSGHVQVVALIEDQRLRGHILGFENGCGIAGVIELHDLGIRATRGVEIAMRIEPQRPEVGQRGVGEGREFRGQNQPPITA